MTTSSNPDRFALRAFLVFLAAVGALGALATLVYDSVQSRKLLLRAAEAAALVSVSAAGPDEAAFLEGKISGVTLPIRGEFVAYMRRQRKGSGSADVDGQIQPLIVETANSVVTISNVDYAFDRLLPGWASVVRQDSPATATEGAIDILGFVSGSAIFATGRAEGRSPSGALAFRATSIVAGDRAGYIARVQEAATFHVWRRLIAFLLLPLMLAYAFWEGRRILSLP